MLCTFTTEEGTLVVRSDDIRAIQDIPDGKAMLHWEMAGDKYDEVILGTALANRDRIAQDELDMIARVEAHRFATQQQLQQGYPVPPVQRGKQGSK